MAVKGRDDSTTEVNKCPLDRYERARSAGIGSNVDRRYRARRCGRATAAAGNAGRAGVHSSPQVPSDHVLAAACFASLRFRRKRSAALASDGLNEAVSAAPAVVTAI
jgi:hypothetical protein